MFFSDTYGQAKTAGNPWAFLPTQLLSTVAPDFAGDLAVSSLACSWVGHKKAAW